jgi:3-dehydroquinate synthase
MKKTVRVELGSRSYDIVIAPELIQNSIKYLEPIIDGKRVAVVSDPWVSKHYQELLKKTLDPITSRWDTYLIEKGEEAKSFGSLEALLDQMLSDGVDRHCMVIAFGGGVVGDVAGFAAALLMRGIQLIQIPTTLMSQVDSSVGGKNGINTRQGKNLVGSFLQPKIVLNDVSILSSLPSDEMKSGYGEIIKYGVLRGNKEFKWLENNLSAIMNHDHDALVEVISMGCETKASIVSEDELDQGKRALVNLGHTFAHAFETLAGFGKFQHGLAVGLGVIAACLLSEKAGFCPPGITDRVKKHGDEAGMPVSLKALDSETSWIKEDLYQKMMHDKKTINGQVNFVLIEDFGKPFVCNTIHKEMVFETLQEIGAV